MLSEEQKLAAVRRARAERGLDPRRTDPPSVVFAPKANSRPSLRDAATAAVARVMQHPEAPSVEQLRDRLLATPDLGADLPPPALAEAFGVRLSGWRDFDYAVAGLEEAGREAEWSFWVRMFGLYDPSSPIGQAIDLLAETARHHADIAVAGYQYEIDDVEAEPPALDEDETVEGRRATELEQLDQAFGDG